MGNLLEKIVLLGQRRFHELNLRAKVVLSQLPLNATMLLVCWIAAAVQIGEFTDAGFLGAQAMALLLLAACALIPWERLPQRSFLVIPLLDFIPVGILRASTEDVLQGLGLLAVFPMMWLAGSGYRPAVMVPLGTAATFLMVWTPHFAEGNSGPYKLTAELVTPFMVMAIGIATAVMTASGMIQRSRVEELLERTELRQRLLDTVLETVDVGVLVLDPKGKRLIMNARQRELHQIALPDGVDEGREPELLVYGENSDQLAPLERRPAYRARNGETFTHNVFRLGAGADARIVSVSARPFRGVSGGQEGSVLAFSDVTEVVKAVRARDRFVAAMSHEFRTPLTSLLGYAELLQEEPCLTASARSDVQVMARNARHLNKMVDDILAAATSDVTEPVRAPIDLARLLREEATSSAPDAVNRGITLQVSADDPLPILGDQTAIVRTIANLVSNALKYSETGGTVVVTGKQEGGWAVCTVEDRGIGIAPEDLQRVFTRFQRSSAAVRSGIPGTGLGLALAREVAVQHGGSLDVESELGVGSVFTLRLPLRQSSR
ncbi:sensor histidine kinase [Sinomonas gamaensis]|uniref:sensor histidine kinase n=1 Tax=Sinomonas gamaensis TaxID=2565624 RepID=UPI001109661C|nr:PAS domain-containing sensor histidine kinase [Sinomonas gamaensis]